MRSPRARPPTVSAAARAQPDPKASPVLQEIELWARHRTDRHDASILASLAALIQEQGRSMPPVVEFHGLRHKAELGKLSQDEAPRLLALREQLGQPLSLRAETILVDRLLDCDPTDLHYLRRFRDLKYQLGEPVDPAREELALRADLLLDPQNGTAAHRLSRVIDAQGKPISRPLEEKALFIDLRDVPGDADCSIRLGRVLEDQAKPVPPEVEEAALRRIVQPGTDEGVRAARLCRIMVRRRRLVPVWLERMAVAHCGQDFHSASGDDTLRDLAAEYEAVLSRWCSEPGRANGLMICNSVPKSGTHLLSQFIRQTSNWRYSRLHFHDLFATVDYAEANRETPSNVMLSDPLDILPRMARGNFATAHLKWSIESEMRLSEVALPVRMAMIYRDPRDAIISQMRWETYSETYARMSEGNRAAQLRMQELGSDGERLSDVLERMLSGEVDCPFLDYIGWLRWPGCLAVSFADLYSDVMAFERGKLGKTARRLGEFFRADLTRADLPDLHRRIYGRGPTFVAGADKVGRFKTVFRRHHYRMIRGTPIEAAIAAWSEISPAEPAPHMTGAAP